ncbi:MAG: DegT/DnrJ/EryC1/StrS family aminotransferase, partial [Smithellaceae bacterium]|nr:DegT/DnrJ/EryC1/StrS family aminotransferase [Smithellaceae bacterium]
IDGQKKNKKAIMSILAQVKGVKFRDVPDREGDSATFLAFNLPDETQASKFQKALAAGGVDTTIYKSNAWHYVPNWEHFLAKSTANSKKNPFSDTRSKVPSYDRKDIPQAEDLLGRTLVMGVTVKCSGERMATIKAAIEKASEVL